MSVTEEDRERAAVMGGPHEPGWNGCYAAQSDRDADCDCGLVQRREAIAQALADERERARAPFLDYADKCAAIGGDPKAGVMKRAVNRSVADAIYRASQGTS